MKKLSLLFLFTISNVLLFAQQRDSVYNAQMKLPGVKMITVFGKYKVWTRKMGDGKIKVLLLHGGPGETHEYLEGLAQYLSKNGIEVYLYDQLGSYFSDQPKVIEGDTLWKMPSRVKEVEQVRKGLGMNSMYLYGHSYGASLGLAYVHKYPQNVKGYIFSSMNTDTTAFGTRLDVVMSQIDSLMRLDVEGKSIMKMKDDSVRYDTTAYWGYQNKLFVKNYLCRTIVVPEKGFDVKDFVLPESANRTMQHTNQLAANEIKRTLYQSPEFNLNLADIKTPVLVIAGKYDFTVSENDLKNIHQKLIHSRLFICENSGHMAMLDDAGEYDAQVLRFLTDVEAKKF